MKELNVPITDYRIFEHRFVLRDGFPFTCITHPANIYDAILIKTLGEKSFSPQFPSFNYSVDEYVDFINKHMIEKALIIAHDIHFLKKCPSLKYLQIVPSNNVQEFDYSILYGLKNLVYLDCATEHGEFFRNRSFIDYSNIDGLIAVKMSGCGHRNINCVKTLKTLSVGESKEKTLENLCASRCLETLQVVNCSIKSLNGVGQSERLQYLELAYNKQLENIAGLETVSETLKSLVIENCGKIRDFSVLEKLKNLENLCLNGSNTLPSLNFIKKMKSLKTLSFNMNILDGDLTPCLELEHVYCSKGKKHYNLKNSELPKSNSCINAGMVGIDTWRRF